MENYDEINFDESESIFKIDGPINRIKFFWTSVGLGIYTVISLVLYLAIYFGFCRFGGPGVIFLISVFSIIYLLPFLYLTFVNYSKRLYDITGSKQKGIILSLVLIILMGALGFISLLFPIIAYLAVLFMRGKLVKTETM